MKYFYKIKLVLFLFGFFLLIFFLFTFSFSSFKDTSLYAYELMKKGKAYKAVYEIFELRMYDLPWQLQFRKVKAGSALRRNPSFLPENLKNRIASRIVKNASSENFNMSIYHIKRMYFASIEEKSNSKNRLTYTVYELSDTKYVSQLVEYYQPLILRKEKRRISLYFNKHFVIVSEISQLSKQKAFKKFYQWLDNKLKGFIQVKY